MTFELIKSHARFTAVAGPWNVLWQLRNGSPFQSHAWLKACVGVSSLGLQLHIGTLWDGPRMTAVVPFIVRQRGLVRVLEWMGQNLSDHCDGLGDPANLTTCWRMVFAHGGYDLSRLKNVRTDAAVAGLLVSTAAISQTDGETCRLLRSTWPDGATWLAQQWPKKRNAYTRGLKKLQESGAVEISFHAKIPPEVLKQLVSMKEVWIRAQHAPAPMIHQGWLAPLIEALVSIDRLLVTLLTCDGAIIAGTISILYGTKMLSYFTAYDLAHMRGSPGIVLLTETIRWAWDHGYTEYDHLRGDYPYKLPFSNDECRLHHYVGVGSMRGRCAVAARELASRWAKQPTMTIPVATESVKQIASDMACAAELNKESSIDYSLVPRGSSVSERPAAAVHNDIR